MGQLSATVSKLSATVSNCQQPTDHQLTTKGQYKQLPNLACVYSMDDWMICVIRGRAHPPRHKGVQVEVRSWWMPSLQLLLPE
jgi:hypothetical protein